MTRPALARTLRLASYLTYLATMAWMSLSAVINPCGGVGCMGNMLSVLLLFAATPVLAAALNAASYGLGERPVSTLKAIELSAFVAPACLVAVLAVQWVVEGRA